MKRSEMVKLMWDFIQEVESDYDIYMSESSTDKLLEKMESAIRIEWDSEEMTLDVLNAIAEEMNQLANRRSEK